MIQASCVLGLSQTETQQHNLAMGAGGCQTEASITQVAKKPFPRSLVCAPILRKIIVNFRHTLYFGL